MQSVSVLPRLKKEKRITTECVSWRWRFYDLLAAGERLGAI